MYWAYKQKMYISTPSQISGYATAQAIPTKMDMIANDIFSVQHISEAASCSLLDDGSRIQLYWNKRLVCALQHHKVIIAPLTSVLNGY
jgi:hypothetical protein